MNDNCKKYVMKGFHRYQCSRKALKDGFCKQHHPETEAKRTKDRHDKWDLENRFDKIQTDIRYLCRDCVLLVTDLVGDNKKAARIVKKMDILKREAEEVRKKLEEYK